MDTISVQSDPLSIDTEHRATTTRTHLATVIRNRGACSSESLDSIETTNTNKQHRAREGACITMATVMDASDRVSIPGVGRARNTTAFLREMEDGGVLGGKAHRPPFNDISSPLTTGHNMCMERNYHQGRGGPGEETTDQPWDTVSAGIPSLSSAEESNGGQPRDHQASEEKERVDHPPKDILFFMRDQRSQTQLKQVH